MLDVPCFDFLTSLYTVSVPFFTGAGNNKHIIIFALFFNYSTNNIDIQWWSHLCWGLPVSAAPQCIEVLAAFLERSHYSGPQTLQYNTVSS